MRSVVCGVCLCIYALLVNFYIFAITHPLIIDDHYGRLIQRSITAGFVTFIYFDIRNSKEYMHREWNLICYVTLMLNYLLWIVNGLGFFNTPADAAKVFITFNSAFFACTGIILILGKKHGIFKNDDYETE